jgi:hypothetical protein
MGYWSEPVLRDKAVFPQWCITVIERSKSPPDRAELELAGRVFGGAA